MLIVLLVVGLGTAVTSCDGGGGMGDLSPDEAENRINSSIDGLSESMGTLEGGGFSTALKDFLGLQNGEATSEEWAERLVEELDTVFESSENPDRFQFEESTGEYAWDSGTRQWTEQGSSGSVILQFPASEGASSNNTTLELSQYSDTDLTVDGETVYLPTSGTGSISVGDSEVFSVNLSEGDYTTEDGLEVPIPHVSFSAAVEQDDWCHRNSTLGNWTASGRAVPAFRELGAARGGRLAPGTPVSGRRVLVVPL